MRKSLILLLTVGLIIVPGCKKDTKKSVKKPVKHGLVKKNKGGKKVKIQNRKELPPEDRHHFIFAPATYH